MLLGIKIDRIEQPLAEHALKTDYNSKGIRFDVYVKDGTGRCSRSSVSSQGRRTIPRSPAGSPPWWVMPRPTRELQRSSPRSGGGSL